MDVTVAICTWNRAALLDQTLAAMCELEVPGEIEWELFVVNNNCTDATDQVAKKYTDLLPLRLLHQPTPGKSYALNYAVREAKGTYLLWTDDDALVAPDWIRVYCEAFERWPHVDILGGRVDPWFEVEPPKWFLEAWPSIKNAYAVREPGSELQPFTTKWPYGVNLAFRTAAHRKYEYDVDLGRQPGSTIGGEEVDLVQRMVADGHTGCWLPAAAVRHFIPKERLTLKYLDDYFYGIGLARANIWSKQPEPKQPQSLFKLRAKAIAGAWRYRLDRAFRKPVV
jgi:glycosyltransferase involved in cell wall biosynthesis